MKRVWLQGVRTRRGPVPRKIWLVMFYEGLKKTFTKRGTNPPGASSKKNLVSYVLRRLKEDIYEDLTMTTYHFQYTIVIPSLERTFVVKITKMLCLCRGRVRRTHTDSYQVSVKTSTSFTAKMATVCFCML